MSQNGWGGSRCGMPIGQSFMRQRYGYLHPYYLPIYSISLPFMSICLLPHFVFKPVVHTYHNKCQLAAQIRGSSGHLHDGADVDAVVVVYLVWVGMGSICALFLALRSFIHPPISLLDFWFLY
ncbi:hypothetical protein F5B17DRAFT_38120 [Nemania serpens]|nr:hypothetical protein F5B17DRAFT_38120 [Nemania serpens]